MFHQDTLCKAINEKVNVKLRYDKDIYERTFSPYIVYVSSKDNLTLAGYQIENPAKPLERDVWHNLTIDKLRSVTLTDKAFRVDPNFDPFDERYRHGIVRCHVTKDI